MQAGKGHLFFLVIATAIWVMRIAKTSRSSYISFDGQVKSLEISHRNVITIVFHCVDHIEQGLGYIKVNSDLSNKVNYAEKGGRLPLLSSYVE